MALLPDRGDEISTLRNLRQEVAQNRTDIQRLWRLMERVVHEPFFIIGGDVDSASISGGGSATGPEPDDGGTGQPPGGGPNPGGGVPNNCCLWKWNGLAWQKLVDNTVDCTCPEPDTPGDFLFEERQTCCEPASSSGSSSGECTVAWHLCDLPCTITVDIDTSGDADLFCPHYDGTYTLDWDEANGWYTDGVCRTFTQSGLSIAWLIRAVPHVSSDYIAVLTDIWIEALPTVAACGALGSGGAGPGANVDIDDCDPLFGDAGVCTSSVITITE